RGPQREDGGGPLQGRQAGGQRGPVRRGAGKAAGRALTASGAVPDRPGQYRLRRCRTAWRHRLHELVIRVDQEWEAATFWEFRRRVWARGPTARGNPAFGRKRRGERAACRGGRGD